MLSITTWLSQSMRERRLQALLRSSLDHPLIPGLKVAPEKETLLGAERMMEKHQIPDEHSGQTETNKERCVGSNSY